MDKHNVKNFTFDAYAGKYARNQFRLWHFSREWRAGIIILTVFKTITWVISIYAGYYFLYNSALPVIGNKFWSVITTLVLLVMIELLVWFFLSKFFKFLYKGIITTAVFSGIIAAGIYFLSFHMSTNGLAMRQADKIDKTEAIVDNTAIEIKEVKARFDERIVDYHKEIEAIKANPAGWRNGKPTRLTADQLKDIKEFNLKIDALEKEKKTEIAALQAVQKSNLQLNEAETSAEANRYYNYVIAIMIAQFIFNGLLMFSWSRIYNENDALQEVNEDIAKAENTIIGNFFNHIAGRLFEEADKIQQSIGQQKSIPFEITKAEDVRPEIAGFSNSSNQKTDSSNSSPNIGFKLSKSSSNANQPSEKKKVESSTILGKLRTNDMLRYCIKRKDEGNLNLTANEVSRQCGVRRWKYFEFRTLMESAGLIKESDKYKKM